MTDATEQGLEGRAAALLDAVVGAELELRALEESCSSLEQAIEQGRETLHTAHNAAEAPMMTEVPAPVAQIEAVPDPEPSETVAPSLEKQAEELRLAMAASAPAPATAGNGEAKDVPAPALKEIKPASPASPAAERPAASVEEGANTDRRPFMPKRTTPLKSRLAGVSNDSPTEEGDTYSERSAELEQLLRGETAS
jgi:hypothetical protein